MKKGFILALPLIFCLLLAGCSEKEDGTLKKKDIYGTYEGSGSVTKYEVPRTEADIKNQRYLFITGDERETQGTFDGIVITFEEDDEDTIWYQNKHTGSSGELVYHSGTGQWEHKADYPLGTVSSAVVFTKDADGTHATFVFTQTFERDHFENPEPSDGVNEFTIYLTKTK
ncbi:MAG TPA: hypothetical protein DD735_07290 [Clostridiales bacterium]|nr:hypothetical protein [Clostridiales bacterium]